MKVLVIGASGQVGGVLLRVLEWTGIKAVGTYQSRPRNPYVPLDITDGKAVARLVQETAPDDAPWKVW